MQFNLFQWIREGVKRSVILGVSDAIDHLGAPPDSEHLQTSLNEFLHHAEDNGGGTATLTAPATTKRKRLGRSLRDLEGKEDEN